MLPPPHPTPRVRIRGDGVAASTCLSLLRTAGLDAFIESSSRRKLPAIMIGAATQRLMTDVLGLPDLFAGFHPIRHRTVLWGDQTAEPVTVEHSAIVVPEEALLNRLQLDPLEAAPGDPRWTIYASRPLPEASREYHFGSRFASASIVELKPDAPTAACAIESVSRGWLFVIPDGQGRGWLLSVGGEPDELLGESRLVARSIGSIISVLGKFPSHPRVVDPLCDGPSQWLACGTAALAFDPLCGDGAGNATREAILASAVVKAALLDHAGPAAVAEHYRNRLLAGFRRHLEVCVNFYGSVHRGSWWDEQREAARAGIAWLSERLDGEPVYRFRLNGFSLEPLS